MEQQASEITYASKGGSGSIIQFLSLYLLVLAFFILLVTISTFEEVKSKAVMDSLNTTFKTVRPAQTDLTVFTSRAGPVLAGPQFLTDIEGLFTTAIEVAQIENLSRREIDRTDPVQRSLDFQTDRRPKLQPAVRRRETDDFKSRSVDVIHGTDRRH